MGTPLHSAEAEFTVPKTFLFSRTGTVFAMAAKLKLRKDFLAAYDSLHRLSCSQQFFEDIPEDQLWIDKSWWFHVLVIVMSQLFIDVFKVLHLIEEQDAFTLLTSWTGLLVMILLAIRSYSFYTRIASFRRLFFKPEIFNCILHRPTSSLRKLIEVTRRVRRTELCVITLFASHAISALLFPIIPPIIEIIGGTNKSYDELFPLYPSVNPINVPWLRKEIKYAGDLLAAIPNFIMWVGIVLMYYTLIKLYQEMHEILMDSLSHGNDLLPGDDPKPLELRLWIEDHALMRMRLPCDSRCISVLACLLAYLYRNNSLREQWKNLKFLLLMFELRDTMSFEMAGSVGVNCFAIGLNMLALVLVPLGPEATLSDKALFYLAFGSYSMLSVCDLFIHCWLASEITYSAENLSKAVYQMDWTAELKQSPQNIVLPLMICRKQIRMTALGVMPVTIQTFIETMRLSYSYYTILKKTQ